MGDNERLGIAFAMTAGAGLATSIGAATVFLPNFDDTKYLGISLSFAAGVMLYVSFVEIFFKSYTAYVSYFDELEGVDTATVAVDDYEPSSKAYYAVTGTFFSGIVITAFLDHLIHVLNEDSKELVKPATKSVPNIVVTAPSMTTDVDGGVSDVNGAPPVRSTAADGEASERGEPRERDEQHLGAPNAEGTAATLNRGLLGSAHGGSRESLEKFIDERSTSYVGAITSRAAVSTAIEDDESETMRERRLLRMALVTGLAITLHNFPEGLATFVAAAQNPTNGAPIAIAIGVHNIPEGICVAAPIYHATKSKWRAFFWGTVSGLAETIAGAIGWIIFSQRDGDMSWLAYAVLFGLVSGMMVYISFKELIVTALEYDVERKYFMPVLTTGMVVMALSLMIFQEA
eukprot:m.55914 g.55914  ORF g.55914 m.55914 type:complete len:402 (-) comp16923_c0_seq1:207-1412(-)